MTTRKLGFSPLLKAIYGRLTTHALTSTYRVYNFAPNDAALPFVTFGSPVGVKSESFTSRDTEAEENVVTVHVWTDDLGDKTAAEMMDNIVQAVTSSALAITAYFNPYLVFLDYADIVLDESIPTQPVRHGVLRFRFHMAPS